MRVWLVVPALILLAVLAVSPLFAQAYTDRPDLWHYGWGGGWEHMLFGSLMMILLWGGIILIVVLAVRWLGGSRAERTAPPARESAMDILNERFARGEIEKEDYEERKKILSS